MYRVDPILWALWTSVKCFGWNSTVTITYLWWRTTIEFGEVSEKSSLISEIVKRRLNLSDSFNDFCKRFLFTCKSRPSIFNHLLEFMIDLGFKMLSLDNLWRISSAVVLPSACRMRITEWIWQLVETLWQRNIKVQDYLLFFNSLVSQLLIYARMSSNVKLLFLE